MNAATLTERRRRFIEAYGEQRTAEGHGSLEDADLLSIPYLRHGSLAPLWRIRARTYGAFEHLVVNTLAHTLKRSVVVLDAGAGNGWLSYRLTLLGHDSTAFDLRASGGASLRTAARYAKHLPVMFKRTCGDFASLPFADGRFDIVAFNASLHYALDLSAVLSEARRVLRPNGRVAILDSPSYRCWAHGEAMIVEKRRNAARTFGDRRDALLSLPFVEYLTEQRIHDGSRALGLVWERRRVRYPVRYELRPLVAWLKRRRPPSRFDLWIGRVEHHAP